MFCSVHILANVGLVGIWVDWNQPHDQQSDHLVTHHQHSNNVLM